MTAPAYQNSPKRGCPEMKSGGISQFSLISGQQCLRRESSLTPFPRGAGYNRQDMERTLAIIKPDAVERKLAGQVIQRIEAAGFRVAAMRLVTLSKAEAEGFYAVHRERPFFPHLTAFMSSGPVVVMVLEADGAIKKWRDLMGATDPAKATPGTLRAAFGSGIERNATHGSDAPETAAFEIGYFFPGVDLV